MSPCHLVMNDETGSSPVRIEKPLLGAFLFLSFFAQGFTVLASTSFHCSYIKFLLLIRG